MAASPASLPPGLEEQQEAEGEEGLLGSRSRSASLLSLGSSSLSSAGSAGRFLLRQRVAQLMSRVEDVSSDEELQEQVSLALDQAFLRCAGGARRPRHPPPIRLHLVTWNVGTASPPPEVSSLLGLNAPEPSVDLYVIGLQEVNSRIVSFLSDMAFDDPWSHFFMAVLSPLGFVKVSSIRMQGLLLLVFAKQALLPFIRDVRSQFTRTGLYGYWGNKGGVATRFSLYGHTVCFLNCHLPAHMENAEQRLDDFEHILEMQHFEGENIPSVMDHDVLFWFGDLNFRIEDYGLHFIRESINKSRFSLLWEKDQLNMAKKREAFLQEFSEGPLKFKPTYKFDLYSNEYDTSGKKRKPAWTDRILWRVKHLLPLTSETREMPEEPAISVSLENYVSHMIYGISDHKPVTGTFCLEVKPLVSAPLVTLHPVGNWTAEQDATVSYSTAPEFLSSAWDWIGLYKVTFRHPNDYVMYAWVQDNEISSGDDAKQVYLGAEELPATGGEFLLGYYSNRMQSIVGLSQPFHIQPNRTLPEKDPFWDGVSETEKLCNEKPPCDL
ncbi:inositol polyphosphate 5-phosphatase K isoform X4 [Sceloporus undulatus]|uniref:inositol polyphosphate 5-phosphatase K isoform X4 n=2 Tax=Sceloporus undulatus TaxID=8520 RepID=UPI001C4CAB4E|nr:inositol polyphosphate 5-phosphatase K isoform X4 [Sceloporus undulatus]